MTHEELCERARRWLSGSRRCDPVYSSVASCREIPDAIGWSGCWKWYGSTVIEAKASASDFYADKQKYLYWKSPDTQRFDCVYRHSRMTKEQAERLGYVLTEYPRMGDYRFYMCDEGVISESLVAKHAPDHGLLWVCGRSVKIVKPAPKREGVDKDSEIRYLRFVIINGKSSAAHIEESESDRPALHGGCFQLAEVRV